MSAEVKPTARDLGSPWLTEQEAALYVRRSPKTLQNLAVSGKGPRYSRMGRRRLYLAAWLDAYLLGGKPEEE